MNAPVQRNVGISLWTPSEELGVDPSAIVAAPMTAVLYVYSNGGNPQGDPRLENAPRVDHITNRGLITAVGLRRQIRDYVTARYAGFQGLGIHLRRKAVLEEDMLAFAESKGLDVSKKDEASELRTASIAENFDNRMFGCVVTGKKLGHVESMDGPFQCSDAMTVAPLVKTSVQITRTSVSSKKESEKGNQFNQTMGDVHKAWGLYRFDMCLSGDLARRNKVTYADLDVLFEAMLQAWQWRPTSTKNQVSVRKAVIFTHEHEMGNAMPFQLYRAVTEEYDEIGRRYEDYRIHVSDNLPKGIGVHVVDL